MCSQEMEGGFRDMRKDELIKMWFYEVLRECNKTVLSKPPPEDGKWLLLFQFFTLIVLLVNHDIMLFLLKYMHGYCIIQVDFRNLK